MSALISWIARRPCSRGRSASCITKSKSGKRQVSESTYPQIVEGGYDLRVRLKTRPSTGKPSRNATESARAAVDSKTNDDMKREAAMSLLWALRAMPEWRSRMDLGRAGTLLPALLEHAARSTPFYRGLSGRGLAGLPLVSRRMVDAERPRFVAERGPGCHGFTVHTSGTTGSPLAIEYDLAAWYDVNFASYQRMAEVAGSSPWPGKPGHVGAVLCTTKKSSRPEDLVLPSLGYSTFLRRVLGRGPVEDERLVREILDLDGPFILHGKPTYLLELASREKALFGESRIRPKVVVVSGENLFADQRDILEMYFSCDVIEAYTSGEGGLIAMSCKKQWGLHVQTDRVVLEVLDDGREVRNEGVGELVLTNLVNWATPILRYATGDRGEISHTSCPCGFEGPTLWPFHGREPADLDLRGRSVSRDVVERWFRDAGILNYQLRRLEGDHGVVVRWVPFMECDPPAVEDALVRTMSNWLGREAVRFERVASVLRTGSKLRRFVGW